MHVVDNIPSSDLLPINSYMDLMRHFAGHLFAAHSRRYWLAAVRDFICAFSPPLSAIGQANQPRRVVVVGDFHSPLPFSLALAASHSSNSPLLESNLVRSEP